MVNLLAFKPNAGKPYEGRTGREAYMAYAATVEHVQGQIGSSLWWSGDLAEPRIGLDPPPFESVGLLAGTTEERAEAPGGDWVAGSKTIVPVGTLVHEPADHRRATARCAPAPPFRRMPGRTT